MTQERAKDLAANIVANAVHDAVRTGTTTPDVVHRFLDHGLHRLVNPHTTDLPYQQHALPPALRQANHVRRLFGLANPQHNLRVYREMNSRTAFAASLTRMTCGVVPMLLAAFFGSLVLAGGAVATLLRPRRRRQTPTPCDYDLFITDASVNGALSTLTAVVDRLSRHPFTQRVHYTCRSVTFFMKSAGAHARTFVVQLILRQYRKTAAVLQSFDLDTVCAAYTGLKVRLSLRAAWAMALGVNVAAAGATSLARFRQWALRGVPSLTAPPLRLDDSTSDSDSDSGGPGAVDWRVRSRSRQQACIRRTTSLMEPLIRCQLRHNSRTAAWRLLQTPPAQLHRIQATAAVQRGGRRLLRSVHIHGEAQ